MNLLKRLFTRSNISSDDKIANAALNLSLEWGENFGKPINARLIKMFPQVSETRAAELDRLCKEIKRYAFDLYYDMVAANTMNEWTVQQKIKTRYPFLDKDNLRRLGTQGMYYAHK
ncbi:hypothetical protein ANRL3_01740 [Anaerolineae bacterium]|nr:hypothetical protein ANRL3_01740 [Anaerolineae bacterium]